METHFVKVTQELRNNISQKKYSHDELVSIRDYFVKAQERKKRMLILSAVFSILIVFLFFLIAYNKIVSKTPIIIFIAMYCVMSLFSFISLFNVIKREKVLFNNLIKDYYPEYELELEIK